MTGANLCQVLEMFSSDDWTANFVDFLDGIFRRDDVPERRVSNNDKLVIGAQCDWQRERIRHDVWE